MIKYFAHFFLLAVIALGSPVVAIADNCAEASIIIDRNTNTPPAEDTDKTLQRALKQCADEPRLFQTIGDYYVHWSKNDIDSEKRAMYNYLATEYYAAGIKAGKGPEIDKMKHKLAALESATDDITTVGIRSIKPYARLNVKVFYEFNSSEITQGGQEQLDILGKYLSEGHSGRIVLEGHTDMAGGERYNLKLSVQRAEAARDYLVEHYHIAPETIEIHGYGFDRLADVEDPFGAKNRRVRVRKLPQ